MEGVDAGSAAFYLNGAFVRIENAEPYALFSDRRGDFRAGELDDGAYTLDVAFFSGRDGSGDQLGSDTFSFTVGEPEITFSLLDGATDAVIDPSLTDGETIAGSGFNIVATPVFDAGSAVFRINGEEIQVENTAPYALFGNRGDDFNTGSLRQASTNSKSSSSRGGVAPASRLGWQACPSPSTPRWTM